MPDVQWTVYVFYTLGDHKGKARVLTDAANSVDAIIKALHTFQDERSPECAVTSATVQTTLV